MRHFAFALAVLFALSTPGLAGAPFFGLVSPPTGKAVGGKSVEISVSFNTGSQDEITYIELEIDGRNVEQRQLDTPKSRGICSFIWDASSVGNGKHRIGVKLFSGDRLLGSVSGECKVANRPPDLSPPVIEYFNVKPGQLVKGQVEIKLRAIDDSGEPPLVSIFVDRELKVLKNNPPYSYIWDTTLYDDGEHAVQAWAYDAAGNRTIAPALKLQVRNQMAPLKLAQSAPAPDKSAAAASTTAPKKEPEAAPAPMIAAAPPVTAPIVPAAPPKTAIPTAEAPVMMAAAPVLPAEAPAIPVGIPTLDTARARATIPGTATGGLALETPALHTEEPLVKFIEPAYSEIAEEDKLIEFEADAEPATTLPKPEMVVARAAEIEVPALGPQLSAPEHLSPMVSIPQVTPAETRVALLPADEYVQAPGKAVEPAIKESPVERFVRLAADVPPGKLRAEMYGEQFVIDAGLMQGTLVAPLRRIWEHADGRGQLFWYPETRTVKGYSRMVDLELQMGNKRAVVNGVPFNMSIAPYVQDGRAMVGLSLLQCAFRMELEYNPKTNQFALVVR